MILPVKTVGVMGDGRTYDFVVGLRAVTSTDGMTADFYPFDMKFIGHVATRIINEVKGVNRVVYDVTSRSRPARSSGSEHVPVTIYGIKNCDTMKKARAWLDKRGVDYAFHDYKTAGIERAQAGSAGARRPAGRRCSTAPALTFKKLPDKDKQGLTEKKAIALMLAQAVDDQAPGARASPAASSLVGFKPENYGEQVRA